MVHKDHSYNPIHVKALRKQTRQSGEYYCLGDEVYYKRDDSPEWRGPAKVLGQDGPVIFLRQGTRRITPHVGYNLLINLIILYHLMIREN